MDKTMKKLTLLSVAIAVALAGCSGDDGKDGTNGSAGANGANGANGSNGLTSLIMQTQLPIGDVMAVLKLILALIVMAMVY